MYIRSPFTFHSSLHTPSALRARPPDSEGQSWWGVLSGFKFHVSGVRLLSPPETGGVPAGGGGMI